MGELTNTLVLAATEEEGGGSFLVSPGLGLMIWTLIAFLTTFFILKKYAFPRIQDALEKRANAVAESIDAAKRTREEATHPAAYDDAGCNDEERGKKLRSEMQRQVYRGASDLFERGKRCVHSEWPVLMAMDCQPVHQTMNSLNPM